MVERLKEGRFEGAREGGKVGGSKRRKVTQSEVDVSLD